MRSLMLYSAWKAMDRRSEHCAPEAKTKMFTLIDVEGKRFFASLMRQFIELSNILSRIEFGWKMLWNQKRTSVSKKGCENGWVVFLCLNICVVFGEGGTIFGQMFKPSTILRCDAFSSKTTADLLFSSRVPRKFCKWKWRQSKASYPGRTKGIGEGSWTCVFVSVHVKDQSSITSSVICQFVRIVSLLRVSSSLNVACTTSHEAGCGDF